MSGDNRIASKNLNANNTALQLKYSECRGGSETSGHVTQWERLGVSRLSLNRFSGMVRHLTKASSLASVHV